MTDYDYEPVVWVSLASVSGLSLISLGQPGLRTDLDEQVYTGGLTAVQTMLGGEIGGDTERFVGGSHSNRTGRFLVKNETGELVGQFLLISPENRVVAPDLVEYYEELVTIFAEDTIQTEVYERTMREFRALGVNDVLDLFLESIKKARKRKSIPMNKDTFFFAVGQVVIKSINDYEYSTTLVKVSEFKGKYSDLHPRIRNDRNNLIAELSNDMLEFLTSEHPHALVTFPKVDSVKKDFLKHILSEIDNLQKQNKVEEGLKEIIEDFEENDLQEVLADFALNEVTKANLHARLEDEIFRKFRREFPLLFLIDPTINGFEKAIEDLTAKINEEYDVAGTLSRIGVDMLKDYKTEENLVIPYIRNFCDQFAAGLTLTAWKYMQILFRIVTMETKIDVTDVLPALQGQIPDSHFSTVQKMITKYKITKLDPLSFQVKRATDILPFYRALFSSLSYGVNSLICQVALGEENPDNYLNNTVKIISEFSNQILYSFAIFSIYSYLERVRPHLDFNLVFPEPEAFKGGVDSTTMDVQIIIAAFNEANITHIQKEHQLVERRLDEFKAAYENRIKDLNKYLSRNPIDISKGYDLELNELKLLSFSSAPVKSTIEILQKTQEEYTKLIEKIQSDLDKAKNAALEFVDGKIAEKKFESVTSNRGFLNKLQDNFQKLLQKTKESINKIYASLPGNIEKTINKFEKDFQKQYSQACPFLNIDRKALTKGDKTFLQDPTSKINKINASINQIITKEEFITWKNVGAYYFSSKNRSLPTNIRLEISNALVHKKSYPFLKEAIEVLKSNPNQDIYRSYTEVLENHTKDTISRIFQETGKIIDKDYIKTDLDIFFIERDKKPVPTIEMGALSSVEAMNSLRGILGSKIAVESDEQDETTFFHVSGVIPDFGCDYGKLKKVWKKKEWTLRKVLLLLSWHSLLNTNSFYMNLLQYSSGFYSVRVKESLEEILGEIEKAIVSN
ncbi:MAG: hypothetical protein JSW11_21435 [Candidatus Heimdallarchaeota archaeon]|nr:MAG: hypothetical protein JSW11_21435 [Candidatus Heimdallarchaeota archaeon]